MAREEARERRTGLQSSPVLAGQLERADMDDFVQRIGMPGFAPTQGHVPSGLPYLPHAAAAMQRGEVSRVMFVAKASVFLSRLTELYDGVSFLLEANGNRSSGG